MEKIRYFKYYYAGTKAVPITISPTEVVVAEPYSEFEIPESAQSELSKVTRFGAVRFIGIVEKAAPAPVPAQPIAQTPHGAHQQATAAELYRQQQLHQQQLQEQYKRRSQIVIKTRIKREPRDDEDGDLVSRQPPPRRRPDNVRVNFPTQQPVMPPPQPMMETAPPPAPLPSVPGGIEISSNITREGNELRGEAGRQSESFIETEGAPTPDEGSEEKTDLKVDNGVKNGEDIGEPNGDAAESKDEVVDEGKEPAVAPAPKKAKRKRSTRKKSTASSSKNKK